MSRTPALVLSCTLMVTPGGWALPCDPSSMWANFLLPMCNAWSTIETQAAQFGPEIDPRSSVWLLPQWQQLLAINSTLTAGQNGTLAQQQLLAYQQLTARGGQSIPYFLSLAAAVNEPAVIVEANWSRCGMMRCGAMRTTAQGNQFMWQVQLQQQVVTLFRTGASCTGNRLGSFTPSLAQGAIAAASPAHTVVSFDYSGTGSL